MPRLKRGCGLAAPPRFELPRRWGGLAVPGVRFGGTHGTEGSSLGLTQIAEDRLKLPFPGIARLSHQFQPRSRRPNAAACRPRGNKRNKLCAPYNVMVVAGCRRATAIGSASHGASCCVLHPLAGSLPRSSSHLGALKPQCASRRPEVAWRAGRVTDGSPRRWTMTREFPVSEIP